MTSSGIGEAETALKFTAQSVKLKCKKEVEAPDYFLFLDILTIAI